MHRELSSQVPDVHPRVFGKHRRFEQHPQMSATAALFKRRLNPVLLEFILQFQQVVE